MPCWWLEPCQESTSQLFAKLYSSFGLWARFRGIEVADVLVATLPMARESNIGGMRTLLLRYTAAISLCLVGMVARAQSTRAVEPGAALSRTTQLLKELSQNSPSTVPDAVLNRTQCVVLIPAATRRLRPGTASCRETSDQWNPPRLVTFEGRAGSRRSADILIFVLTDAAVKSLRSGSLQVASSTKTLAPVAPKRAIPTEQELNRNVLTYEYAGHKLSSSRIQGVVRPEKDAERARSDKVLSDASKKITRQYLSALTSFFNTIIPTGIVIHHTAVLPDEGAPPRNEKEVDKYHATKGFEITCSGHVYHVAYHYLILTSGRIQKGRPERCEGAHAKNYNSYLGISIVGDFDSRDNPKGEKGPTQPNPKQMAALVRLSHQLMLRYQIPVSHVVRHSDIAVTRCPGDRFPFAALLRELKTPGLKSSSRAQ
jgi:N-acetylmuramoyl-L-alanine amidase